MTVKTEKQTYYVVSRSGDLTIYGNQTKEPSGFYVTTSRKKALAKQGAILDSKKAR